MPLLRQIPKEIKERVYTHKGFYAGVVPIYLIWEDGVDYESGDYEMYMIERNGIPSYSIYTVRFLWSVLTYFHPIVPPVYVTGEI